MTESEENESEDEDKMGIRDAKSALRSSSVQIEKIRKHAAEVERAVRELSGDGSTDNPITAIEDAIHRAKEDLNDHRIIRARREVKNARSRIRSLDNEIMKMKRNVALIRILLEDIQTTEDDRKLLVSCLHRASLHVEDGQLGDAITSMQGGIEDVSGNDPSRFNPFHYRAFWMGVEARWPAGSNHGILVIRIENDGQSTMPEMVLAPPIPNGWEGSPTQIDVPPIDPGAAVNLRFNLIPSRSLGSDSIPLMRTVSIATGYTVEHGDVRIAMRVQNRSLTTLRNVVLSPWVPRGFLLKTYPAIIKLKAGEEANVWIRPDADLGDVYVSS